MGREDTLKVLSEHLVEIRKKFDVESLSVFGSVARGESGPASDCDILVQYVQSPGLFKFLELKDYLERLIGQPVDLVTDKALKAQLREQILREAVRVH